MMAVLRNQNIGNADRYIGSNTEAIAPEAAAAAASTPAVPEKRCYSVEELQHILGASDKTVYNLIKSKVFHSFQLGPRGRIFVSKKSFDAWLDHQM